MNIFFAVNRAIVNLISFSFSWYRRWSHVFPPGEAEFKRHSGPLWNSLCQPAVLPLSTDYLPEEYELNDPEKFEFNHYNIFIDAMDRSYYNSYSELLSEMVIQRIIQDYQIVSQDVLDERLQSSEFKKKSDAKRSGPPLKSFNLRSALLAQSNESAVQHILSMGHNVVYLRYNKHADVIEVVQYHAKFAQNDDSSNTYTYRYLLWMPLSADFQPVSLILYVYLMNFFSYIHAIAILTKCHPVLFDSFLKQKVWIILPLEQT